jgi:hypothetical protein
MSFCVIAAATSNFSAHYFDENGYIRGMVAHEPAADAAAAAGDAAAVPATNAWRVPVFAGRFDLGEMQLDERSVAHWVLREMLHVPGITGVMRVEELSFQIAATRDFSDRSSRANTIIGKTLAEWRRRVVVEQRCIVIRNGTNAPFADVIVLAPKRVVLIQAKHYPNSFLVPDASIEEFAKMGALPTELRGGAELDKKLTAKKLAAKEQVTANKSKPSTASVLTTMATQSAAVVEALRRCCRADGDDITAVDVHRVIIVDEKRRSNPIERFRIDGSYYDCVVLDATIPRKDDPKQVAAGSPRSWSAQVVEWRSLLWPVVQHEHSSTSSSVTDKLTRNIGDGVPVLDSMLRSIVRGDDRELKYGEKK